MLDHISRLLENIDSRIPVIGKTGRGNKAYGRGKGKENSDITRRKRGAGPLVCQSKNDSPPSSTPWRANNDVEISV